MPGLAAVLGPPGLSYGGVELAVVVDLQQGGVGVTKDVQVRGLLGVQDEKALQLTGAGALPGNQVLEGLAAIAGGGSGGAAASVAVVAAISRGGILAAAIIAARGKYQHSGQQQRQDTGCLSLHRVCHSSHNCQTKRSPRWEPRAEPPELAGGNAHCSRTAVREQNGSGAICGSRELLPYLLPII